MRKWINIIEENLKLSKNQLPTLRGRYSAFIITMHPSDFLKLTASPHDRDHIEQQIDNGEFPRADFGDEGYGENGKFDLPFLTVEYPSGKVLGHEGRHRAMMVLKQGATKFPVSIMLRSSSKYELRYKDDNGKNFSETFTTYEDAENRKYELPDEYYGATIDTIGRAAIKGSPTKTVGDIHHGNAKPFDSDDMPKTLIAEYSDDISVSGFRIGLVKGYNHFN